MKSVFSVGNRHSAYSEDQNQFRAIAYARMGRRSLAMDDLHAAYSMTHGNNVINFFIEGEVDMRYLIDIAKEETADRFDKVWLDTIFTKANNLSRQIT